LGRAVRTCSNVVRAGWLARQAIVSEGQEAGRLDAWGGSCSAAGISGSQQAPGQAIARVSSPGALGSPLAMQQAGAVGCRYAGRRNVNKVR